MDVNRQPTTERDLAGRPGPGAIGEVARTEIAVVGEGLARTVAAPIAMVVAVVVCFPILILTMAGVILLTQPLVAIGLPPAVQGVVVLVVGFGGGLAIDFVILLRILRALPPRVRRVAFELDEPAAAQPGPRPEHAAPLSSADIAALDARLAPPPSGGRQSSSEQSDR